MDKVSLSVLRLMVLSLVVKRLPRLPYRRGVDCLRKFNSLIDMARCLLLRRKNDSKILRFDCNKSREHRVASSHITGNSNVLNVTEIILSPNVELLQTV